METGVPQPRRDGILAQPAKTKLVPAREQHHYGRGNSQSRERESELDGRMNCLTGLNAGTQVGAGDDKQPTRCAVLTMRHISIVLPSAGRR